MKLFSQKERAIHLSPYKLEQLKRCDSTPLHAIPDFEQLSFDRSERPASIVNAMRDHQAMLDAIRDGLINKSVADAPVDLDERANHLKSFGYFADASIVGATLISDEALLTEPYLNPDIARLAQELRTRQTKTLASGIDLIMADLKESMEAPPSTIEGHTHALVFLYEHPRDPTPDEPGTDWIMDATAHRSNLLAAETAVVIANYLRVLGYDSRAHTASSADVDLNTLAVCAGVAIMRDHQLVAPFLGTRFGIAAVTSTFEFTPDKPLDPSTVSAHDSASQRYHNRRFMDGAQPFEKLKRVDKPTTFIDELRVPRVPKRTDMFSRALFGDMGKKLQDGAKGGHYVRKSAPSTAQRRALGAFVLLQDGESAPEPSPIDPTRASELIKATSYFLGVDAVGISRCPSWSWYSHDATGAEIIPPHDQAISMIVDQGFDSMEGSSGDDWISVALSMRAYLRFSLLGGVVAKQLRNLGYKAKAHTVIDGEVLQPPLLLLSGLGEVSRIGEVILNPYLGPRLKSGAVTTNLPMQHDKPIDFGLQSFCNSCKKCARECPSGAITAGPKLMFNGYEIWKSDSQKCATYRVTTPGGAMCGRCMKTCPWNLEGVLSDAVFRWTAMKIPGTAPALAKLDDMLGRGSLNPVKKWWWDLEIQEDGAYRPTDKPVNARELQKDLNLQYEDQTLAVYPANLAPHPYPYPYPMDREKGIAAYEALITAEQYQEKLKNGELDGIAHKYKLDTDSPVLELKIISAVPQSSNVIKYEFARADGGELPTWQAGAHLDIVVAPEYLRQYSMCGNPAERNSYQIGVLREDQGRGGSTLMHRIFSTGRKVFVAKPVNHFPLHESASKSYLFGGGIGITPMIAMAHRLHSISADFEIHYSGRSRNTMGFIDDMLGFPWADRFTLHVSDEGTRADLLALLHNPPTGTHVYTCGAEPYMQSVMDTAEQVGVPEDHRHLEYFSVPDVPDYENHEFVLKLVKSGKQIIVPSDQSAADVLVENGISIDIKCADGLCGVCQCGLVSGDVEHRDFVLSKTQQQTAFITCQSRATQPKGVVELDL